MEGRGPEEEDLECNNNKIQCSKMRALLCKARCMQLWQRTREQQEGFLNRAEKYPYYLNTS